MAAGLTGKGVLFATYAAVMIVVTPLTGQPQPQHLRSPGMPGPSGLIHGEICPVNKYVAELPFGSAEILERRDKPAWRRR
jgi:hypothetical protein